MSDFPWFVELKWVVVKCSYVDRLYHDMASDFCYRIKGTYYDIFVFISFHQERMSQ